jgi:hypothetical protein
VLCHGFSDLPGRSLKAGRILPAVPQTAQDLKYGFIDFEAGCGADSQCYREVTWDYAQRLVK